MSFLEHYKPVKPACKVQYKQTPTGGGPIHVLTITGMYAETASKLQMCLDLAHSTAKITAREDSVEIRYGEEVILETTTDVGGLLATGIMFGIFQ